MPSNSKLFVKPFIGGLNTELSSVEDAILHTSDELNCTILPEGMRGRRLGFNIERDGKWIESNLSVTSSIFYWDGVGKKDLNYIVVQRGTTLYFFINNSINTSPLSIDLTSYMVTTDIERLRYATCAGDLIVVGDWIDPIKISWDYNTLEFKVVKVNIKWRDLVGVDDGLEVDETPSELTPEHKYNLFNQGWDKFVYTGTDGTARKTALDAFHDATGTYPSNSMLHYLDKTSDSTYDTLEILKHFYGDTPSPKGHYILDYFSRSRSKASGIVLTPDESSSTVTQFKTGFSLAGNNRGQEANFALQRWNYAYEYFKDWSNPEYILNVPQSGKVSSISLSLKDFVSPNYSDSGDQIGADRWTTGISRYSLTLYGQSEDGEQIIKTETYVLPTEGGYGDTPAMTDLWSFDTPISYDKYYFKVRLLGIERETKICCWPHWRLDTEFVYTEKTLPANEVVEGRVKDITTLGGRYFYLAGDTVLFSQVLKDDGTGYDACHQEADPTSEEINDVVATDGGYVKFPSMGKGQAIASFNRGVIVFGKTSVYGIISPMEQVLTATSYDIVELSKAGLIGAGSVVSTSDRIFYWSPLGIFQIGLHAETGNTVVAQSISISTIQEFYNNIPTFSKEHCEGAYDYVNNRIYWYYPTNESVTNRLDGCLVFDLTYNAFMVFKIGDNTTDLPHISHVCKTPEVYEIAPTMYVRADSNRVVVGGVPIIAAEETSTYNRWTALKHVIQNDEGLFSFGDYNSREFKDFDKHVYDSFMVSRPIMFESYSAYGNPINTTYGDKQVPILQTLFKRTEQCELAPKQPTTSVKKEDKMTVDTFATYTSTTMDKSKGVFKGGNVVADLSGFEKDLWTLDVSVYGYKDGKSIGRVGHGVYNPFSGEKPDTVTVTVKPTSDAVCDYVVVSVNAHHGQSTTNKKADLHTVATVVMDATTAEDKRKQYLAASGANIRMRWGWALDERSNRWDIVQNGYRPQKDFLHDEYVESRIHVRGRGKAFQVEIRNDSNKDFRLAGMNLLVRSR